MKRIFILLLLFSVILAGCGQEEVKNEDKVGEKDAALLDPAQKTIELLSAEAKKVDVQLPDFVNGRPDVVQENYALSYEYSEVLKYMPCFCGCVNQGHESNFNCFIKEKNGKEVVWDKMGLNCDICNGIARESISLYKEGNSLLDIRNHIDKKYGDYGPSTKTPMPSEEL
jgi:hypothetical protein